MGVETLILVLVIFVLVSALIAVEARDLLSSVVALGATGIAISVIDLFAGAPDLTIPQVVVEVIALVLLVRLVVDRKDFSTTRPRDLMRTGAAMLACGLVLAVVCVALGGFSSKGVVPPFGKPLLTHTAADAVQPGVASDYLARAADDTGSANSVMAVLLDYRAYDTLGEATVIFVSVLGVYVMLRKRGRRKEAGEA